MANRSELFKQIRPTLKTPINPNQSLAEESFQNQVLRPILKLQNDLLISVLANYFKKHKNSFYSLTLEKRLQYIAHAIQKDVKFRNSLKGMIIGCFSSEEYDVYTYHSSALNKRMMGMLVERYQSQIQLFENPKSQEII